MKPRACVASQGVRVLATGRPWSGPGTRSRSASSASKPAAAPLTTEQIVGWMRMMAITPLTLAGGREVLVNWRGVVAAELTAT